jgi:phenylalanyl-tRNA synthetase beta chain
MKVTLNWLKQYVNFDWSPEELAERLTMLGLEVEGLHKLGGEFDGILVAQVITRDKHPNADKLSLCRVDDGKGERQIVCGAQNFKAGDKVPLILPGASLPLKPGEKEPFTIKVGKIRGVESHGMMCSPKELGIADDAEGLMILREDAKVGQPFAEYLGRNGSDVVYDLEVTPNRPDLNSVIGIARELSALTGNRLKLPDVPPGMTSTPSQTKDRDAVERIPTAGDLVAVQVEDADLCPRYVARIVQGVKIGPSPEWLRSTLKKIGIRSTNNVVDVTNYVMMEIGQPLHAFDYHLIARGRSHENASVSSRPSSHVGESNVPTIVVRRAHDGELFMTLDSQKRTLTSEMLLIADETKAIALAGVMGGQNTEINEKTVDVLIESAYFKPQNIRATSKKLELRTESSYRFERGADIGITEWASRRAAQLILKTAGGQLAAGAIDVYTQPIKSKEITLRHQRTDALLGVEIGTEQQVRLLASLDLEVVETGSASLASSSRAEVKDTAERALTTTFRIPTWRVDLKQEIDLIEEVARLYGVDKIQATPPRGAIGSNDFDAVHDQLAEAARILAGLGLNEAQGQTLISGAEASLVAPDTASRQTVELANPLSSDMNVLRPSLIPGLLDALRHNLHHKSGDVALFEIGRVFVQTNGQLKEERRVAIALTGRRHPPFWGGIGSEVSIEAIKDLKSIMDLGNYDERLVKFDHFDLKGIIEEFLENFGLRGVFYSMLPNNARFFEVSATISLGGKLLLGEIGQLKPYLARVYDLRDPVLLAELDLDLLLKRRNQTKSFKPLPAFPSIRRDVAMIVPEATAHEAILNIVKQVKPQNLESVDLFDVFRGKNVSGGQKSMAYAFTYRAADRTLTDAEVNAAHAGVVEAFKQQLRVVIREG